MRERKMTHKKLSIFDLFSESEKREYEWIYKRIEEAKTLNELELARKCMGYFMWIKINKYKKNFFNN